MARADVVVRHRRAALDAAYVLPLCLFPVALVMLGGVLWLSR